MKYKCNTRVYNTKKEAFIISGAIFLVGITWDTFSVWRGYWIFPGHGLVGIKIGLLPIEEYTLFIITPYWLLMFYNYMRSRLSANL